MNAGGLCPLVSFCPGTEMTSTGSTAGACALSFTGSAGTASHFTHDRTKYHTALESSAAGALIG